MANCNQCGSTHERGSPECPARRLSETIDDRYRIDSLIGQGGFGAVYRATHVRIGCKCAVKFLHPKWSGIGTFRDYGLHEDGCLYLVMEWLGGSNLREHVRKLDGPLPVKETITIAIEVLGGLEAAHRQGIIHRDLKPENIFLQRTTTGQAIRILDFGIAKVIRESAATNILGIADRSLTQPGDPMMGSILYISPEQIGNFRDIDVTSDIYSFGAVLYYLLTGQSPHSDKDNIIRSVILGAIDRQPINLRPEVPEWLGKLVERALNLDPKKRFQSAREMKTVFESNGIENAEPTVCASRPELAEQASSGTHPHSSTAPTIELVADTTRKAPKVLAVVTGTAIVLISFFQLLNSGPGPLNFLRPDRPIPAKSERSESDRTTSLNSELDKAELPSGSQTNNTLDQSFDVTSGPLFDPFKAKDDDSEPDAGHGVELPDVEQPSLEDSEAARAADFDSDQPAALEPELAAKIVRQPPRPEAPPPQRKSALQTNSVNGVDDGSYIYDWYLRLLGSRITSNWTRPRVAADVQTELYFRLQRDGSINHITVSHPSGLSEFDEAALRAIENSTPFAPLPRAYKKSFLGIEINVSRSIIVSPKIGKSDVERGIERPEIFLDPLALEFSSTTVGTVSDSRFLRIVNSGSGPLNIAEIILRGSGAREFTARPVGCTTSPLKPKQSCGVEVRFKPHRGGATKAELVVRHNAGDLGWTKTTEQPLVSGSDATALQEATSRVELRGLGRVP